MIDLESIKEAGLTDGEAKVYLAMLKKGQSTVGPIIEESKVANSIIYRILESLIEKGLVSFIIKEKTKYFKAENPKKIIEYIEKNKEKAEANKLKIEKMLPALIAIGDNEGKTSVQVYEGFKGVQTAYEHYYSKLKKGEGIFCWGIYPEQEERYHLYWQRDHTRRGKLGIFSKMLFNKGTDRTILKNRNSYKLADARYMPTDMKTPAWFMVYKDTVIITLQTKHEMAVEIVNQDIADTFKAYFDDFWSKSKHFK